MGGGFNVLKGKSLTESVIEMKKRGYSGFVTDADTWLAAKDSEIRELRAALKEHDAVFYEVGAGTKASSARMLRGAKTSSQSSRSASRPRKRIGCPMVGTCTGSCDPNSYINVHPKTGRKRPGN